MIYICRCTEVDWPLKSLNNKHRESLCFRWDSKPIFCFMTTGGWNSITRLVGIPSPGWLGFHHPVDLSRISYPGIPKTMMLTFFFSPLKKRRFFSTKYYPHFFQTFRNPGGTVIFLQKLNFQSRSNSSCVMKVLPWKLTRPLKINGWKMYSLLK